MIDEADRDWDGGGGGGDSRLFITRSILARDPPISLPRNLGLDTLSEWGYGFGTQLSYVGVRQLFPGLLAPRVNQV